MIYHPKHRLRALLMFQDARRDDRMFPVVFSFPLLFGVLVGSIFAVFSSVVFPRTRVSELLLPYDYDVPFSVTLFRALAYPVCAFLLSTSYLGILLFPLLTLFCGATLGYSVSYLFASGGFSGLASALLALGVPSLLGLTAYLISARRCFPLSLRLFPASRSVRGGSFASFSFPEASLVLILAAAEALYCRFLLPVLLVFFGI